MFQLSKKKPRHKLDKYIKKPKEKKSDIMNARLLYFIQSDIAELVKKKIEDGMVTIGNKRWNIDTSSPIFLKKTLGYEPLFIIKHDNVMPDNVLNPIKPQFIKDKDDKINPEILRKTMSLKILGNMLKVKKEINWVMATLLGIGFGAFLVYYLIVMKIIKI